MSLDVLIISPTMLKERSMIHGNVDDKLIYPEIKIVQDMYILPILGTALYDKIQTLISGSTISDAGNADYKTLVDRYIVDTMIYYTMSELQTSISYQTWNKGVVRKQGDNTELPTMDEIVSMSYKYKQRAEFYANRLMLYLKQNAPLKFPEYITPGSGLDTIYPETKTFTMPIYLGPDEPCKKSYEQMYQGNKPNCDC